METTLIKKSIQINAPQQKVWHVLLTDEPMRNWMAEFNPGSQAIIDSWTEGNTVIFTDDSRKSGMIGKLTTCREPEQLTIEYTGMYEDGKEDYESQVAKDWAGLVESYTLTERNGGTYLAIESDMSNEYYEHMASAWDRALEKIKTMAEA